MKKEIALGISILIIAITFIGSYTYLASKNEKSIESKEKQRNNLNMLTMMLETEDGNYVEKTANDWPLEGYVFNSELSKCENGGIVTFNEETKKINMQTNISDKCYVYFDIKKEPAIIFSNYIINTVYTTDGANGLYYHDGQGTYTNASEEAEDNSYRYSGASPINYVCFGSDEAACPGNNLYRIIGLFDDDQDGIYNIKLIKNTSIGNYSYDDSGDNTWSSTVKPKIYTTLTTAYWDALTNECQIKIDETHQWQVGGMVLSKTSTPKQYYNTEIKEQSGYKETMAVGLMYVSDYGYAASPDNWQTELWNYDNNKNTNNNWLYSGQDELTISAYSDSVNASFTIDESGMIGGTVVNYGMAVRPTFYLKYDIAFAGGTGTVSDPYRIVG